MDALYAAGYNVHATERSLGDPFQLHVEALGEAAVTEVTGIVRNVDGGATPMVYDTDG